MRILIVEDEIKIRRGMAGLIEHHTEHTVVGEARNGQEGAEMAMMYQPDLIITDIRMPVMNGLDMIRVLQEQGGTWHFVILSGYSEFEYAKQAIRYGVDDYLIKPLAPEDVTDLLKNVSDKIEKERIRTQGKPEKRLKDFLIESETLSEGNLGAVCGISASESFRLICAYVGMAAQEGRNACVDRFEKLTRQFREQKIYYFFIENTREFVCLAEDRNWEAIKHEVEYKLLQKKIDNCEWVWACARVDGLGNLKRVYEKLKNCYLYGMVLGTDTFLTEERIEAFHPEAYTYPKNLENQIQKAFYRDKKEEFVQSAEEFVKELAEHKIKPVQIKEWYMKMANFFMNLGQENNKRIYEQLQNLNIVKNIGAALTRKELENIFREVVHVFVQNINQRQDISNYTIKRAIDYIRNHYAESVSLDGVAASLDITPEYLSTLFNREMGENFSLFLKKFRISHAKRLLKGTDMKIYEIAQAVGYADPKYFNRVFKEEEGISPGDYRALQ